MLAVKIYKRHVTEYGINNLEHVQSEKLRGRQIMRKFAISIAAMTAFAALLSVPANALESWGPTTVGNQCFASALHWGREGRFGYWEACPQTASVAAAARHRVRRHQH
jgi:hypothetical protein